MIEPSALRSPDADPDDGEPKGFAEFKPELLEGFHTGGFETPEVNRLLAARHVLQKGGAGMSLQPLLPLLLNLKGEPFTIQRMPGKRAKASPGYFPFEPFYRTRLPRKELIKSGRQVAKSTGLAARGIVRANCIPYFNILYITPLFEQVRRLSQNYVRPFIETSPVRGLFVGTSTTNSVLQRSFLNHSQLHFSYAFTDAERTRGLPADEIDIDEVQNLDKLLLPIIRETLSGSRWKGIETYAGTPKALENTIEQLWLDSSQAEWCIKCHHCGYWNVPALSHDLDKMIGPMRDDISYEKPALVCAKCGKFVLPQLGRWVHAHPNRRWSFIGRHIPQLIMPMHFADPEKWAELLAKRDGAGNTPLNVFYNEVCGESYDTGSRIVTLTDLKRACLLPWPRELSRARDESDLDYYTARVLSIDWGGGGEQETSFTVYAVLGMCPDGKIDVIFGYRSLTPHDHIREAKLAIGLASQFKCHAIAHDYNGSGATRETIIVQAGYPVDRVLPVSYVRVGATSRVMSFKPGTKARPRSYYQIDKTRSLLLVCNQIKTQWIRFFQYDHASADELGLIDDFLGLVDEKVDSKLGSDVYTITRDPARSDDFAHAVNMGCCALWNMSDKWPNLATVAHAKVPKALLDAMHPQDKDVIRDLI